MDPWDHEPDSDSDGTGNNGSDSADTDFDDAGGIEQGNLPDADSPDYQ